jgi:hypothetical protein
MSAKPGTPATLTPAMMRSLRIVAQRQYRAGEPRMSYLNQKSREALLGRGLITARPHSQAGAAQDDDPIVDLTEAGRACLPELRPAGADEVHRLRQVQGAAITLRAAYREPDFQRGRVARSRAFDALMALLPKD